MMNEEFICKICYEERKEVGILECNHEICIECILKLKLGKENCLCPICRAPMNKVIFDTIPHENFQNYNEQKLIPFNDTNILCKNNYIFEYVKSIVGNICKLCKCKLSDTSELTIHLKEIHDLYLCQICLRTLNLFPKDYIYYSESELHLHQFDPLTGHPHCEFCLKHFYTNTELQNHNRTEHYYCNICSDNILYRDINEYYQHACDKHFMCRSSKCMKSNHLEIFKTEAEFIDHRVLHHFESLTPTEYQFINERIPNKPSTNIFTQSKPILYEDDFQAFPSLTNDTKLHINSPCKIHKTTPLHTQTKPLPTYDEDFPPLIKNLKLDDKPNIPWGNDKIPSKVNIQPQQLSLKTPQINISKNLLDDNEYPTLEQAPNNNKNETKNDTNSFLFNKVKTVCRNNQIKIDKFMSLCGQYYLKQITPKSFKRKSNNIIGCENFNILLPLLIDSLDGELKDNLQNLIKTDKNIHPFI